MWEVLLEFSPDVDLNQVCEVLMDTEYWMGISCCIRCEIFDVEGLCNVRAKPWAPTTQDVEWINPSDKHSIPPFGALGRLHLYDEELARQEEPSSNSYMVQLATCYPVYTAPVQDLGILYQLAYSG